MICGVLIVELGKWVKLLSFFFCNLLTNVLPQIWHPKLILAFCFCFSCFAMRVICSEMPVWDFIVFFLTNSIGCLHSGSAFLGSESSAAVFLVKLLFTQLNSPVHYAYPPHASTIAPVHKVGRE